MKGGHYTRLQPPAEPRPAIPYRRSHDSGIRLETTGELCPIESFGGIPDNPRSLPESRDEDGVPQTTVSE